MPEIIECVDRYKTPVICPKGYKTQIITTELNKLKSEPTKALRIDLQRLDLSPEYFYYIMRKWNKEHKEQMEYTVTNIHEYAGAYARLKLEEPTDPMTR